MYFTDRGIEELQQRRGDEPLTYAWLADELRTFVDLNPQFETPIERLATWLARRDEDEFDSGFDSGFDDGFDGKAGASSDDGAAESNPSQ